MARESRQSVSTFGRPERKAPVLTLKGSPRPHGANLPWDLIMNWSTGIASARLPRPGRTTVGEAN
jgi:hypothetical protein